MLKRPQAAVVSALTCAFILAACGSGGGGVPGLPSTNPSSTPTTGPTSAPTGTPVVTPTTQPTNQPTTQPTGNPTSNPTSNPTGAPVTPSPGSMYLQVNVKVPLQTSSSLLRVRPLIRRRMDLSPAAQSVQLVITSPFNETLDFTIGASNLSCSTDTSGTFELCDFYVPITGIAVGGTLTFSAYFYATNNETGTIIAEALNQTVTITVGGTATLGFSLSGVPAYVDLLNNSGLISSALSIPVSVSGGTSETSTANVQALDAAGYVIVQSTSSGGSFASPISVLMGGTAGSAISVSPNPISSIAAGASSVPVVWTYGYSAPFNAFDLATLSLGNLPFYGVSGQPTSIPAYPMLYAAPTLANVLPAYRATFSPITFTVSEPSYTGAFSISHSGSSIFTVTCSPSTCAPASAGSTVSVSLAPTGSVGSETVTVADGYTASKAFALSESTGPLTTIPTTLSFTGLGAVSMQSVVVGENGTNPGSITVDSNNSTCLKDKTASVEGVTTLNGVAASQPNSMASVFYITPVGADICTLVFDDGNGQSSTMTLDILSAVLNGS